MWEIFEDRLKSPVHADIINDVSKIFMGQLMRGAQSNMTLPAGHTCYLPDNQIWSISSPIHHDKPTSLAPPSVFQ